MRTRRRVPERGEVWLVSLDPQRGSEMQKTRPCLVLTPKEYNARSGMAIVTPITSVAKGYPFEVALASTAVQGVILADQVRSIDWTLRCVRRMQTLSAEVTGEVVRKVCVLISEQ